jgi:hypothetical protein
VLILQTYLELENQQLISQNKTLIAEYEKNLIELKHRVVKKEFSMAINLSSINIYTF